MSSPRKNEKQIIKSEQAVQRHPKGFRLLYDDFLEPNLFNGLRDLITDNSFPWNYRLGVVLKKDWDYEPTEDWALSHLVWHGHSGVVSPMSYELQPYMTSIFQQLDIEIPCRIKFNLGIRRNTNYETGYHIDCGFATSATTQKGYFDYKTAIIYFNDCNGYTQFKKDGAPVKSKANRMIIFDGNLQHQGVLQTDTQMRYVLNLNYIAPTVPPNGRPF